MDVRRTVYVSDLDGTLLDGLARLSSRTRSGLEALLGEGLLFTVASARSVVAMRIILSGLKLPLPVVEFNGAFVSDMATGAHLVTNAMAPAAARGAFDIIRSAGCLPLVSTFDGSADRLYYVEVTNPGVEWYVNDRVRSGDPRVTRTDNLAAGLSEQVVCLTAIERPARAERLRERLVDEFGTSLSVRRFRNDYFPGWDWLTVNDAHATKDRALALMLAMSGLADAETVAFGDSDNDLPLFRAADRGIAVGNASAELKSVADEVIGPSTEDAVVRYIERDSAAGLEGRRAQRRRAARSGTRGREEARRTDRPGG